MSSADWSRVTDLFDRACRLPAAEREAWVRSVCDEEATCAEVRAMLRAYDADPGFLEAPIDVAAAVEMVGWHVARSVEGRRIGRYRVVREIGRGGMGVVYEAERDDAEFERRVAIKVLPAGWAAPALAERFRFERRVLAGLDHPNIAGLLDAGSTDDGVPYFVMDYVDGRPIDAWCREHALTPRERVRLLVAVCDAVAHAHQHLVVHRDLKPANILVTADGAPNLLDFGIATVVSEEGGTSAGLTRAGQSTFTPEYASPEQVRGERVTTATDVYSLGVLAYRLLAERPPYDLSGLSPLESMRAICESTPPFPSSVAAPAARGLLRGDLDTIVMKALRKDARERYATVSELAADLAAWLDGRPVSAAPATFGYRARKLVARHRTAVIAATAVLLALVAGGVGTAWQAHVASVERDKAERRFAQVRQFSRSLLFEVHESLRRLPGATEPRRLLLDRAVQFLDGLAADAGDDVALNLELVAGYRRLGHVEGAATSDNVGDLAGARRSFEAAVRLAERALLADPRSAAALVAVAEASGDLSNTLLAVGDHAAAERAHARSRDAVERLERDHAAAPGIAATIAASCLNLGYFRGVRGDLAEAKSLYEKAVRLYDALPAGVPDRDEVDRGHARALKRLAAVLVKDKRLDEGEARYRQALALDEAVVARNPGNAPFRYDMTFSLTDLAFVARERGDVPTAEMLYRRALAIRQEVLDADPSNSRALQGVANIHQYLSSIYGSKGEFAKAADALRLSLALSDRLPAAVAATPAVRINRAWGHLNLATSLLQQAERASPRDRAAAVTGARAALQRAASIAPAAAEWRTTDHQDFLELLAEQQAILRQFAR
jgi:non-specific serine/threonine protein kinase/serine/threonine-protein kinase